MPVLHRDGTHLTDVQQEEWIDNIIIPSLRESCPDDILQHHPRSFAEVKIKATAKQEWHPTGVQQPIDLRSCIPEEYLDCFWNLVLQKCNSPRFAIFREVFLIVQGHNLKLFTKKLDPQQVRQDYFRHLRQCFHANERYMPAQKCWVDLGLEDTPEPFQNEAVTLLRKSKCCASWNIQFQAVDQRSSLLRTQEFPWALTRDIMSTRAEILPTNKWHAKGGIAFNKAYSLHKDLFTTPVKGLVPFDHQQLEGLAYDQDLLNRWYGLSYRGRQTSHLDKRQHLLKIYQHAKQRVNQAICSTIDTCFGVRQEYRMTLERFSRLQLDAALNDAASNDPYRHRPYYVFRTKDVNTYIGYDINRWLMCLEALICQVNPGPIGLSPASAEQQMINGVMLPSDLILWEGLPMFKPDIIPRLGLAINGFGRQRNQTLRIQNLLQQEHRELALFREWLQRSLTFPKESLDPHARKWVFQLGAELIIQSYQLEILDILRQRSKELDPRIDIVQERFDAIQSKGLEGFSYDLLTRLLEMPPHLILVKKAARRGVSLLDQYNTGTWIGRIAGLFGLDDNMPGAVKKRGWEHSPFREWKRRLRHIVKDVLGPKTSKSFEKVINLHACQKMWIIPQYNIDKLSVIRTASKHNAPKTFEMLQEMETLSRTNWVIPQLNPLYFGMFEALEQSVQQESRLSTGSNPHWQEIHEQLTRADQLLLLTEGDIHSEDSGLIKNPIQFGIDTKLNLALEFKNQLERTREN
ncbi:MAG: hypothetical protein M1824_002928 [Vezdaea acicularis]|nr:MAG: hypothetical protein M1824_002928 [Vezdaea acicularis]